MASPDSQPRQRSTFREYLEALVVAGIFLGFTNTFVFKTFFIPSESMVDTLLVGDHLIVNRFIFGIEELPGVSKVLPLRDVQRGDIVVFRSPEQLELDLVKRCVAIEGDVVQLVEKDLYINGKKVDDDSYTQHGDPFMRPARDNLQPRTVPKDHVFCLGDNRDFSNDSRYWGFLPTEYVKGRASLVYWSYGGETPDGTWRGFGHRLKQLGATALGFITKTRWSRTFHLIR